MIKFNDWELDSLYEKIEDLRKKLNCDAILNDTPEDLDLYQKPYIRDILTVYKNELENILIKECL